MGLEATLVALEPCLVASGDEASDSQTLVVSAEGEGAEEDTEQARTERRTAQKYEVLS